MSKNAIEVTVKGFENKQDLAGNQETDTLTAPTGLVALEDQITPTEIPLVWDVVEGATEYQLEIDGKINSGITTNEFLVGVLHITLLTHLEFELQIVMDIRHGVRL